MTCGQLHRTALRRLPSLAPQLDAPGRGAATHAVCTCFNLTSAALAITRSRAVEEIAMKRSDDLPLAAARPLPLEGEVGSRGRAESPCFANVSARSHVQADLRAETGSGPPFGCGGAPFGRRRFCRC